MDDDDPRQQMALCRYQAISAYLALDPLRGQRRALLEQLAAKTWPGPDGEPMRAPRRCAAGCAATAATACPG